MSEDRLIRFVAESNRIEGIVRDPTEAECAAHLNFLDGPLDIAALERFVSVVQPGASLRRHRGMNVRVGDHIAPAGGPGIETRLAKLLRSDKSPFGRHVAYETLHPFMDGNGRSGRVLWLRDMGGLDRVPLGFLHHWYYSTLAAVGRSDNASEANR